MAEEKRQIRLVHQREGEGPLLIADIDQGVPREHLDEERGQEVYIPYDRLTFVMDGTAASVDRNPDIPGYIDLVPSDKVMLSREHGAIAGLSAQGLVDVIEIPTGDLNTPTITGANQTGTSDVTVTGTNFESFDPYETEVTIDGTAIDADDVTVDSSTQITVSTGVAYDDGEEVVVTANDQDSNAEAVSLSK